MLRNTPKMSVNTLNAAGKNGKKREFCNYTMLDLQAFA